MCADSVAQMLTTMFSRVAWKKTVVCVGAFITLLTMWLFVTTTPESSYLVPLRHPLPIRSTPVKNFVYIKTHKCASETLAALFRRYGYERRLSFVLPVDGRNNLGWPEPLDEGMFRPSKTGGYNVLCEHTILTLPLMTDIMPNDTLYVTGIREPMEHLKSSFHYFNLPKVGAISGTDPFTEYLRNLDKYDAVYKAQGNTRRGGYCVPAGLSVTKNSMAFDLGFPIGFARGTIDQTKNKTFIDEWVEKLDKRFAIILIVEYFQESLVLMRRTFGWNIKDIIYIRRNSAAVRKAVAPPVDPQLVRKYRTWSRVDYSLYNHFNRTLWRKIADEGDDFENELGYFESVVSKTNTFCEKTGKDRETLLHFAATDWSASFNVSINDCKTIGSRLMPELRRQYDSINVKVKFRRRTGVAC